VINLKKGLPNLRKESVRPKTLLTLRQKKLLDSGDFFTVFHEVHNPHLKMLNAKIGKVEVVTDEDN
jgi:hypothetical protein